MQESTLRTTCLPRHDHDAVKLSTLTMSPSEPAASATKIRAMLRLLDRSKNQPAVHVLTTQAVIAFRSLPRTSADNSGPPADTGGGHVQHTNPATAMIDKELYRVTEAMEILSLKRSVIYEQLRSGRLRSVHVGRTRLITAAAIHDYVALIETEAVADAPFGAAS